MKSYINLFNYYRQEFNKVSIYILIKHYFIYTTTIAGVFMIVLIVLQFFLFYRINYLNKENKTLKENYSAKKPLQEKIKILVEKKQEIENFLKEDANFFTYYRLMDQFITNSKSAVLVHFSLDNEQKTTFVIQVDKEDLESLYNSIENDSFLEKFISLRVLDVVPIENDKNQYKFSFEGKFKQINETSI
ncbi:hypothetical protein A2966_03720 [Candidatus Roizmanbacteria bacterium RIFCSPLOWO2_01_FULL_41_22]|uniref:PilN domain-containing protein n=2 Tax=Candidatus Roizmaniibacteriota TaxID=1752723 RepID=A0A1F7JQ44_9BACT|nr:MAG: hypothetical protein A2966_03720 [Candidatus Roizmanbacteria bacterium RIFCSPLOWO2_01_FULL_41_22]OGK57728.1 MAG: hypothetical protein A3H86_03365 [Candidatus Roizmanbacteria bacterium RIFCSPLOWO2_02_FULL_41_9]